MAGMTVAAAGRAALLASVALTLLSMSGCGEPAVPPPADRTYESTLAGYRFIAPPHWKVLRDEVRSPLGTLITVKVLSLEQVDETFVKQLPQSLVPHLVQWTKYFFSVVDKPAVRDTSIGGQPALEVDFPVRIRARDLQEWVSYWVVRRGNILYVLRAAFPPDAKKVDGKGVAALLGSWTFSEPHGEWAQGPPGSFTITLPAAVPTPSTPAH
jgi:hypothetical protein